MVWIAAAVAAVQIGATIYSASKSGSTTGTSTSKPEFPEETRRLFQDVELPLLQGSLGEQEALVSPFLGGGFRKNSGFLNEQYGKAPNLALSAARHGAKEAGIGDLGPIFESTQGLQPEFLAALKELTTQRGQQENSIVPAGYGQFLSPSTFSQSSSAGPSAYDTGFQVAGSLAKVAGAYYGSTSGSSSTASTAPIT